MLLLGELMREREHAAVKGYPEQFVVVQRSVYFPLKNGVSASRLGLSAIIICAPGAHCELPSLEA